MRRLLTASALAVGVVIGLRLLSDELTDPLDVALLAYVGVVSAMSALLTARRTAIWTTLGIGVLFGAIAIAVHALHGAAIMGGLPIPALAVSVIFDIIRALLFVGYTYTMLGWLEHREERPQEPNGDGRMGSHQATK